MPEFSLQQKIGVFMCGIAGWFASVNPERAKAQLAAMLKPMHHRGPDGSGTYFAKTENGKQSVAFGHLRLAIIDLSTGDQPMSDATGNYRIVYNGELYNYLELREELRARGAQFKTASDTEVVLQSYIVWGAEGLAKLRGMFAFAIHDIAKNELFLARDRYGKKPLFVYETPQGLFFASEIKALLQINGFERQLDFNSVQDYLLFRYVPSPNTFVKNVRKRPAGYFAIYSNGNLKQASYYRLADAWMKPELRPRGDPQEKFSKALEEAVRVRMVADVPFGIFLSGGLDSSVIAALMSRHIGTQVQSFSVGFEDPRYTEAPYAQTVSKFLNTKHQVLNVSAAEVFDALPRAIELSDAPVAESSSIMILLLAKMAQKSVKMVLTGEGADEMLAGYPKHYFERFSAAYQMMVPQAVHDRLVRPLTAILPFGARRMKTAIETMGLPDSRERWARWFGALNYTERNELLSRCEEYRPLDATPYEANPNQSALRKALYFDQSQLLPDNYLERGDRMTMGAGIEARMPFMDHQLAETVSSLPDAMRISGRHQKWCLRKLASQLLPREIAWRQKRGFSTPMRNWLQNQLRDPLHDLLLSSNSVSQAFLQRRQVSQAIADHCDGRVDNEKLLWMLLNLEMFLRQASLSA
jgi:asparagine synthase (glutamine-hydrolysing)